MKTTYLAECIHCPMKFNPDQAGQPADDGRGGVFSGWFLPQGSTPGPRHDHEVETCAQHCGKDVDPADGMLCGDECRLQYIRECGE